MGNQITEIVFILDESGSMWELKQDTLGGFNSMLDQQKKENGKIYVSTIMFSNSSRVVHDRLPLERVGNLTEKDYCPNGSTALLDAVGNAIQHIHHIHKYARKEDVPEKTMFIITTDGMENCSRKYSRKEIKKMIEKKQKKHNWEFIFLGANIDSAETASHLGILKENAVDYISDQCGTETMWKAVGSCIQESKISPRERKWKESLIQDTQKRK